MDLRVDPDSMDYLSKESHGITSFSQPIRIDNINGFSQAAAMDTDGPNPRVPANISSSPFVDIFPSDRITRFYSQSSPENVYLRLISLLDQFLVPYREYQHLLKVNTFFIDVRLDLQL